MSFGGGSGSSSISGSTDVVLNSPANNNVLGYNSGLSKWQNQDLNSTYALVAEPIGAAAQTFATAHSAYFDAEAYKPSHTDLQAIQAACAAATAAGQANMVRLSARAWDVGNGLSLSGYTCGLVGMGAGHDGTNPTGTVLYASTQTGAVLDLTGWLYPDSFRGRVEFGNFVLRGSNVADPTKVKIGLRRATVAIGSAYFHDIIVIGTGGPGLDFFQAYLCDFERITAVTPVSAKANDVPYMIFRGCNGNRFNGLGFRSLSASADTGSSGALVVTDDGTYQSEGNVWIAPWFEYLHVPTNGTFISNKANAQNWRDVYFVDCSKESGATGTSYVVFGPSAITNYGGNSWSGLVPGRDSTAPTVSPDTGIIVSQNQNRIDGVKGYNGTNVTITTGIDHTYVHLAGAVSGASDPAILDNSGLTDPNNHNITIDRYMNVERRASLVLQRPDDPNQADIYVGGTATAAHLFQNSVGNGSGFYIRTAATNQTVSIQHSWSQTSAVFSGQAYVPALSLKAPSNHDPAIQADPISPFLVQGLGSSGPSLCAGAGSPAGVLAAPVGSLYMRTDGGAATTLYVKESGAATSAGWVAK